MGAEEAIADDDDDDNDGDDDDVLAIDESIEAEGEKVMTTSLAMGDVAETEGRTGRYPCVMASVNVHESKELDTTPTRGSLRERTVERHEREVIAG